ncbi:MAG: L,D-transpeptidase family protein [Bacteroidota bacterium]|nr:L,D-transpeptidase family protein [Bacteroidota bacterium]
MKKLAILIFCLYLVSCNNEATNEVKKVEVKAPQDVNAEVLKIIGEIYSNNKNDTLLIVNKDTLITFPFFERLKPKTELLFSDKGKLTPLGDSVFTVIKNARNYGLYNNDYHFKSLKNLTDSFFNKTESTYEASNIATAEILLTDAYLKFGAHLNKGRFNPDTIMLEWNPKKLDTNWVEVLKMGLTKNNITLAFDSLEPKHEGYHFLKQALVNYIKEHEAVNWDSISFKTDTLTLKQKLKERLTATGFYNDSLPVNDSLKLAKAIKLFQQQFNLEPDGKLGKYTKQALGMDKETTIRQMEMALEHWRWEPYKYPEKYAIVNIPSAEINVWEWDRKHKEDTLVLNSRIVVGKPENQTPTLKSKINYMMIYPYWSVPFKIAWKEILPMVQRDTNYLHKKNFEVIDGKGNVVTNIGKLNWKKFNEHYLPIRFRQRIGNENSLGICKFNFNNKYGVYLHDTNSKRYFKTFYRYQSHGCMRLEKFVELSRFLIREDTLKIPYDTLNAYFARPIQQQINLRKPLQLYVRYYTAYVDDDRKLQKFIDIYRKNETMIKMVYK